MALGYAISWQFEGECRSQDDDLVRSTVDLAAADIFSRTLERFPDHEIWVPVLFGDEPDPASALFGAVIDPSKDWVRRPGLFAADCVSMDVVLRTIDDLVADWARPPVTVELNGQGDVARLIANEFSFGEFLEEHGTIQAEFVVTYDDLHALRFPDEQDIHGAP